MSLTLIVLSKELRDNFRDRRTLLSALVLGPLLGPMVFVAVMKLSLEQAISTPDKPLKMAITGGRRAPNLIEFLKQYGVVETAKPRDRGAALAAVRSARQDLVLFVPQDYRERFRAGLPARLELILDTSNRRTAGDARRASLLIQGWGRQIAALRLQARGLDPSITQVIHLEEVDVSTPTGRSVVLLGMMSYLLIFSTLVGGMYLAIDTTAGERERGSLEPLLTLPVNRSTLIGGKILATCLFMALSLAMALVAFAIALQFLPLQELGMSTNLNSGAVATAFLVLLPFVFFGAALMTVVASFTKSYKEAQSYMTAVLLLPTLPIMVAALVSVRPSLAWMLVPSLSQHLLLTELIKDEALSSAYVATSIFSTLGWGAALTLLAMRLYRREAVLG